jgi:hypothetical protein
MKKIFLILTLIIFCVPTSAFAIGVNKTMDCVMSSWMGESLDAVIGQWGYPADEKTIAGRKLYYWHRTMGGGYYGNTGYGSLACTRILEVDESKTVVRGQWEGNNCPFAKCGAYRNWENKNNSCKAKSKKL